MKASTFTFKDHDGIDIFVYKWLPGSGTLKACIQFAHGVVEHAGRYTGLTERCTRAGYALYANDHRGHGKTAGTESNRGKLGPGGVDSVVKDIAQLTGIIKKENPGVRVFIVGASWGSALVHLYIMQHAREVQGAVFGGLSDLPAFLVPLAVWIVQGRIKKYGPDAPNTLATLGKKTNKDFLPSPTAPIGTG